MKKKKKYLPLYYKWMEDGRMRDYGLCQSLASSNGDDILINLFEPTKQDIKHFDQSLNIGSISEQPLYWGSDCKEMRLQLFTPLRQTILLLMAAMNNEL